MTLFLPFWQRLLATIAAMLAASYLVGVVWQLIFGMTIPSYVAGVVGGLASLPIWEFFKRIRPKVD